MSKYNTFLTVFIISIVALIFFLVFYLNAVFALVVDAHEYENMDAFEALSTILSPSVLVSGLLLGLSSLVYRILGIVHVARSKTVADGEKALWIIGFIIMGFVTAIVFLIMAKGRKFVE
jgi:uncharacterized membrane protein